MKTVATISALCCAPGAEPLPESERAVLAGRFKALADPARVGIVNLLSSTDEVCVCELTEPLRLSQPTVSHHLKILREAGLVSASRRGTWSFYRLEPAALDELAASIGVGLAHASGALTASSR